MSTKEIQWFQEAAMVALVMVATLNCTQTAHSDTLHQRKQLKGRPCGANISSFVRMHYTALQCTELHYTALHSTNVLHCTALNSSLSIFHLDDSQPTIRPQLHCTALHITALNCTTLHCTKLHSTLIQSAFHYLALSRHTAIVMSEVY